MYKVYILCTKLKYLNDKCKYLNIVEEQTHYFTGYYLACDII